MKGSGLLVVTVLVCIGATAFAQVSNDGASSASATCHRLSATCRRLSAKCHRLSAMRHRLSAMRQQSAQPDVQSAPPPRPPTYTPEQLFGPSTPPASSTNTNTGIDPTTVPRQLPGPSNNASPPADRPLSCPTPSPPPATSHPGVSASQFKRAGVGAEAFTRPGVSAEALNALRPGARSNPCAPPRNVILYPEPLTPSRRIPQTSDEP